MTTITGFRDGRRVIITVIRRPGGATATRRHHPDCPCTTHRKAAAR